MAREGLSKPRCVSRSKVTGDMPRASAASTLESASFHPDGFELSCVIMDTSFGSAPPQIYRHALVKRGVFSFLVYPVSRISSRSAGRFFRCALGHPLHAFRIDYREIG